MLFGVLVAGGVGASVRYVVDFYLTAWLRFPGVGIAVVNALGSFFVGVLIGAESDLSALAFWPPQVVLAVGFCGGFTTFSTAIVQVLTAWLADRRWWALGLTVGTLTVCVAAFWCGLALTNI